MCGVCGKGMMLYGECVGYVRIVWEGSCPVREVFGVFGGMVLSCAGTVRTMCGVRKGIILRGERVGCVCIVREWSYPVRAVYGICAECVEMVLPCDGIVRKLCEKFGKRVFCALGALGSNLVEQN